MAWFGKRKVRDVVRSPAKEQNIEVSEYNLWQLVSEIHNLSSSIDMIYAEYDIMEANVIIGAALNMYADNAVQISEQVPEVISIVAEDKQLRDDLNAIMKKFDIEGKLWNTSYSLAKYGNQYWRIFTSKDGKDVDSLEIIDDPACVLDLYIKGEPKFFAFNPDDRTLQKTMEFELYDRESFVHFKIQSGKNPDTIKLPDQTLIDPETNLPLIIKYQIIRGESMLEGARIIYRILKALEDSLLAARIAKSEYTKIYNVEGGPDLSPIDGKKLLDKVKRLFDSRMTMDVRDGQKSAISYNQPRAFMDPIFNITSNGVGAIDVKTTGGEFEVKDIADIEYFNKLLFSSLHITPSMLAFEENIPGSGFGGDNAMVQQDIRFAMYEKNLINGITTGVAEFLNLCLRILGRSKEQNKFQVRMTTPSVAEDMAKIAQLKERISSLKELTETISEAAPGVNSAKVLKLLMDEFIPDKQLLKKLEKELDVASEIGEKEAKIAKAEQDAAIRQLNDDTLEVKLDDKNNITN